MIDHILDLMFITEVTTWQGFSVSVSADTRGRSGYGTHVVISDKNLKPIAVLTDIDTAMLMGYLAKSYPTESCPVHRPRGYRWSLRSCSCVVVLRSQLGAARGQIAMNELGRPGIKDPLRGSL